MKYLLIIIVFVFQLGKNFGQDDFFDHKETLLLMGTRFEITAISDSQEISINAVNKGIKEIQRIEELISSWKQNSQTTMINNSAGINPVKVDRELFNLIERSIKVSELTNGAFDITFGSIEKLYQFDKTEQQMPSDSIRLKSVQKINYKNIELNKTNQTVFLKEIGMKIGFGGIGKGYAANRALEIIQNIPGVKGGLVNAAGDLKAWGISNNKEGWPIQISDPENINNSIAWLNLMDNAIVTSGDYEKYFTSNGVRYAHIINPKTGIPTTGIKSVTIICPDAELADALATSVFVLGETDGLKLIDKLKHVEALIINDQNELLSSKNLKINTY